MTTADEADAPTPEHPTPVSAGMAAPESPGQQLRQAREARKLDISHVATALRLTPQVVEAIERDDYAPLPSATFVSGYIRSYARLVGLDPEPLNQRFRRLHPNAEPPPRHFARGDHHGEQADGGGLGGVLILALIVIAVAAGGYAWWVMRPGPDEQAQGASTPESSAPQSTATAMRGQQRGFASESAAMMGTNTEADSPNDQARSALDEPPASAAETSPEPILGSSSDIRMAEPGTEPPISVTDPLIASLPTPPSPEVEGPTARATETRTPTDATEETVAAPADPETQAVELNFNGPCWVDIRDATGKVLLFGEMSRGSRETLDGQPPYSLVIGNAAAVELTVGGAPYDLRSVARGNVARFELDPTEIGAQTPNTTPGATD